MDLLSDYMSKNTIIDSTKLHLSYIRNVGVLQQVDLLWLMVNLCGRDLKEMP